MVWMEDTLDRLAHHQNNMLPCVPSELVVVPYQSTHWTENNYNMSNGLPWGVANEYAANKETTTKKKKKRRGARRYYTTVFMQ